MVKRKEGGQLTPATHKLLKLFFFFFLRLGHITTQMLAALWPYMTRGQLDKAKRSCLNDLCAKRYIFDIKFGCQFSLRDPLWRIVKNELAMCVGVIWRKRSPGDHVCACVYEVIKLVNEIKGNNIIFFFFFEKNRYWITFLSKKRNDVWFKDSI